MNNEVTPIDLILKINEIKSDLELLSNLINEKIRKENHIFIGLNNLNSNLHYNINNLNDKVKSVINAQIEVLSISVKDTINEIKSDLITTTKRELEKDINYKLNILENEFKTAYKTIFENAFNDLKAFNNDLENSKNLDDLKAYSYSLIKQQKEIITKQDDINENISNKLDIFNYMFSFKWWVLPSLGVIVGLILAILINKYVLINYFNYYQTEQTATAITNLNKVIAEQQALINKLQSQEMQIKKYDIAIHEQNNKVYLAINKKNYKNNLIENANKNYSYIELIK